MHGGTSDAADWTDAPTSWWRPAALALGLTVAASLVVAAVDGTSRATTIAWVGLFLTLVLLVTAVSTRSYGHLRLTDDALHVGRHVYPLTDLDPAALRAQTVLGRPLRPGDQGPDATPVPRPHSAAGAWAPPLGTRTLLVRTLDGRWYAVATSDPMALLAELVRRVG